MRHLFILILLSGTLNSISIKAQPHINIDTIGILPLNVTDQDSIQIFFKVSTPSMSYYLDKAFIQTAGNINITACYLDNRAAVVSHHQDTIKTGMLSQGKYQINLQAFLSADSACLNRIDSNSIVDSFMVSAAVSIQERQWIDQLKIFPNPAKDVLNIHLQYKNLTIEELKVKDLQGREIKIQIWDLEPNFKRINLNKLPSGIYFLEIKSNKGNTVRQFEVQQY